MAASAAETINHTGTVGAGTAPISFAKSVQSQRPRAIPAGTPITIPVMAAHDAWQATAAASCRWVNPRAFSNARSARLVVLNLPNLAGLPFLAGASPSQRQAAQRASVGMTTTVINPLRAADLAVIDLMCDARLYQPAIYSSDGFHPNDAGYAILASEVVQAATSSSYPAPQGGCAQTTLVP